MDQDIDPIAGQWYRDSGNGRLFQVIDVDHDEGTIEIQHFDGDLEEIELDRWLELDIEVTAEPEDWTGALDGLGIEADAADIQSDWDDAGDTVGTLQTSESPPDADELSDEELQDTIEAMEPPPERPTMNLFRDDEADSPEDD